MNVYERMNNYNNNLDIDPESVSVATFKVARKKTSITYAMLFAHHDKDDNLHYDFYSLGGTFTSSDGEYRKRIIKCDYLATMKEKYAAQFSIIEREVLSKYANKELKFQVDLFTRDVSSDLEKTLSENRVVIDLYCVCWLCDYRDIHRQIIDNHINPAYTYILYQKRDVEVYKEIKDSVNIKQLQSDLSLDHRLGGVKLMPLNIRDLSEQGTMSSPVWREIYASYTCSDLVYNKISLSFPLTGRWFFIQRIHEGLFDNFNMHQKFSNIKLAKKIIKKLNRINDYVRREPSNIINDLNVIVRRIDAELNYTDISMGLMTEYCGRTFRDYPALIKANSADGSVFQDEKIFKKIMFDYIYGCLAMHLNSQIIHSDLHLNNVTIKPTPSHSITVNIGNKYYKLPTAQYQGCIIDFSRCIMVNLEVMHANYSKKQVEFYRRECAHNLISILQGYFPEFVENNSVRLKTACFNNMEIMFKICTLIDVYMLVGNILQMEISESADLHAINYWRYKDFLSQINKYISETIINNLNLVLDDKLTTLEYPVIGLISKFFTEFEVVTSDADLVLLNPKTINFTNGELHNWTRNIKKAELVEEKKYTGAAEWMFI